MNKIAIIYWIISVILIGVDFLLRRRFDLWYLNLSIPIFRKKINDSLCLIQEEANKIHRLADTKYYIDQTGSNIWLQCNFKNRRSTLGLLKRWKYLASNKRITEEQTRISIGIIFAGIFIALMLFNYLENIGLEFGKDVSLNFFYIFVCIVMIINYSFAFNRLRKESRESLNKISKIKLGN
jgi:hypothetical protein